MDEKSYTAKSKSAQQGFYKPMGTQLPKISIVTPSYNQGQFLEQTIRSVVEQDYPNLEYIVMDGGSTDNSVEIIKKYENRIAYWQSEKDNGQADAIAKGFAMATGDILGWINSDDYLMQGALEVVGRTFNKKPEQMWLTGKCIFVNSSGVPYNVVVPQKQSLRSMLFWGGLFAQQSTFWKKEAYQAVGGLDTSLHFAFDFDLFTRLQQHEPVKVIPEYLAAFRFHDNSKSVSMPEKFKPEGKLIIRRLINASLLYFKIKYLCSGRNPLQRFRNKRIWNKDKALIKKLCKWVTNETLLGN